MKLGRGLVKRMLREFGLDIRKYAPDRSPSAQMAAVLRNFQIDLVFDVGANQGQFATEIRAGGYVGDIISFEPLTAAYAALLKLSERDEKWNVHPRCALGAKSGETEINIAANSASSSLLPMLESHIQAAPHTAYIGSESVSLQTLDSIAVDYVTKYKNPFLKIDTQGYEWDVLDGAKRVLPHLRGVLLELSLIPLYEGQHLWRDLIDRLETEGFSLWALQPGFTDPRDGRTLQADGVFIRG